MHSFLIYDSIGSPLQTKTDLFNLIRKNGRLKIITQKDLADGKAVETTLSEIREFFRKTNPLHSHFLLWNGSELGCKTIISLLRTNAKTILSSKGTPIDFFGKYKIIEQGFYPQSETLRFCKHPVGEECWGNIYYGSSFDRYVDHHFTNRTERLEQLQKLIPKNISKLCFVSQLSYDTSLKLAGDTHTSLSDSLELLLDRLGTESVRNMVICPHPQNKENCKKYKFNIPKIEKISYSNKPTKEECADSDLVVGFNSTFLLESSMSNTTLCLDENSYCTHIMSEEQIKQVLKFQFKPKEIDFYDFTELCHLNIGDFLPESI